MARIAAVTATLVAVVGLTACVGNNTGTGAGGTAVTTAPVTSASPTTIPTMTTKPPPIVEFASPTDGETVSPEVVTRGTAQNLVRKEIWIVLEFDGSYYPQRGPVKVRGDGTWKSPRIFIGGPNDSGTEWDIHAVLANSPDARQWFVDYLEKGEKSKSFPGKTSLPADADINSSVMVIRE